jgi:hypothetical protein
MAIAGRRFRAAFPVPRRVRDHLPPEEAEARRRKRHAINVWRPVGSLC